MVLAEPKRLVLLSEAFLPVEKINGALHVTGAKRALFEVWHFFSFFLSCYGTRRTSIDNEIFLEVQKPQSPPWSNAIALRFLNFGLGQVGEPTPYTEFLVKYLPMRSATLARDASGRLVWRKY